MMRIGILGYGNLGKGAELAVRAADDMELVGVFTRRDPQSVKTMYADVYSIDQLEDFHGKIDVMICCGGSATDLPKQTPEVARWFNVVDSFDTHAKVNQHFDAVDEAATAGYTTAIIGVGWDPGMFSLQRLYGWAFLPKSKYYVFWGPGLSQGHSDAARRSEGVKDARQYTLPIEETVDIIRSGKTPDYKATDMHTRVCYVVPEEGADLEAIEQEIKTMPNYFAGYKTTVKFISEEELRKKYAGMEHGGFVLTVGSTGEHDEHKHISEYNLKLDSNPEFTASVLVAYARAACAMNERGQTGCFSVFDVPPSDLSPLSGRELRTKLL